MSESELPPLTPETFWAILREEISDQTVNQLLAYYLGYRYDPVEQVWDTSLVEDSWRREYPEPPDFIANRPPVVKLTRSIPVANKQLLKEQLGFQGYKIGEFTPRHTRRATAVNWLLSYVAEHPEKNPGPEEPISALTPDLSPNPGRGE